MLATQGAGVVVNGRDAHAVEAAGKRISGVAHPGSPAESATADALIDTCIREFGRIDILVNCAGTAEPPGSSILIDRSTPSFLGYRDHHDAPPWSVAELHAMITRLS
jgi:NAD(P)-dependent dehydrogenase (short-subunit alcohol dehydrogenase family)